MVFDWDDQGVNHKISDMCQSADMRPWLDKLHYANPNFKATLFAIPGEMTPEQLKWFKANESWVELAMHGFFHTSNYECVEMNYEEFNDAMSDISETSAYGVFVKGFKAPGWQISDDCYRWLQDNGWWVADQAYNNERRPQALRAYVNNNGEFRASHGGVQSDTIDAWHGHTWNCVGNGIEETFDHVKGLVEKATEFKFVSEVLQ